VGASALHFHCRLIYIVQQYSIAQSCVLGIAIICAPFVAALMRWRGSESMRSKLRGALMPLVAGDVVVISAHFIVVLVILVLWIKPRVRPHETGLWTAVIIVLFWPVVMVTTYAVLESMHLPEHSKFKTFGQQHKCCRIAWNIYKNVTIGWALLILCIIIAGGSLSAAQPEMQARNEQGKACHGGSTIFRELCLLMIPSVIAGVMSMLADFTKRDIILTSVTVALSLLFTALTVASSSSSTNGTDYAVLGSAALHAILLSVLSLLHNRRKKNAEAAKPEVSDVPAQDMPTAPAVALPPQWHAQPSAQWQGLTPPQWQVPPPQWQAPPQLHGQAPPQWQGQPVQWQGQPPHWQEPQWQARPPMQRHWQPSP
jgi:hypothetical protein